MFSNVIQAGDDMFSNKIQPTSELYAAARSGSLDDVKNILEKYKSQGLKPDLGTVSAAIKSGNVSLVQYFKDEHGLTPKSGLMEAIDVAKSLEMARYLVKEYPTMLRTVDHTITWAAARTGDLECLKFILQAGRPWLRADEGTLYDAVRGGSLPMVKYVVEECGISDIDEAHEFADKSGKKEIEKYLQDRMNDRPKMSH